MKQIMQNLKTGKIDVANVPCPQVSSGGFLIRTRHSLISSGTERMLLDFGKANVIDKARQQPDKVRMILDKVKTDGLLSTIETVRNKLDQPLPLGYCNAGVITAVGEGVVGFKVGERVASNGKHAEMVSVPINLCAKIPDNVSDDEAAFTVLGAIALQGIRLANPTLGETVVVIGLGLIGLITVQLLRAQGCRVLGLDLVRSRLKLARAFGAETVDLSTNQDPLLISRSFSRGRGVDAVIISATAKDSKPVHQAALMCRKRGRIVLVGVTDLELSRAEFYEKELTFQVSCSYGPGRYDPNYEEKGQDYPIGFVRWTAQRNFESVLDMMAQGALDVKPLISHRFDIAEAKTAYEIMLGPQSSLGILLGYNSSSEVLKQTTIIRNKPIKAGHDPVVSFIGSGNYATSVLIPAFKSAGAHLKTVASKTGVSGLHAGRKHGFIETTTDVDALISDKSTDAVVITTRHESHARFVLQAIEAGKHIFVEKPLCLTLGESTKIEEAYRKRADTETPLLMVGFNRRFAPQTAKIKELLESISEPKSFIMTVSAGAIPADHWIQDPTVGGGRIIGEVCHFIDLLRYLAANPIKTCQHTMMSASTRDTLSIQLTFHDGSIGTIHYFANGSKTFPKERLEVFCSGRVLQLDNFRKLKGFGWPNFKKISLLSQDKGHKTCVKSFLNAIEHGKASPYTN